MKRLIGLVKLAAILAILLVALPLHAEMKFNYYPTYAPFGWDDNGKMKGIYLDVLNHLLVDKMGIELKHKAYPWKRAQKMVKTGESDALCTVPTAGRLEYSDVVEEPVVVANFRIYASATGAKLAALKKVRSIPELKAFKMADIAGSKWAENNLKSAGLKIHWMKSTKQIFQFIIKDRADATVGNDWITRDLLKKLNFQDKIVELPTPMTSKPVSFNILISKKSPYHKLIPEINKNLKKMKADGTYDKILARWK